MKFFDDVQTTVLENGFTVVTHHVPGHLKTAASIIVASGSFHEDGLTGGFHFLEHLFVHSHPEMSKYEFVDKMRDLCVKAGIFTDDDSMQATACGVNARVHEFMDTMALMIAAGAYTREDMEGERGRIWAEMHGRENTRESAQLRERLHAFFGEDSPAARPIGGKSEDIRVLPYEYTRALREKHVVGKNMLLVTAGGMTHEQAVDLARAHFAHLPEGQRYPRTTGEMFMKDVLLPEEESRGQTVNMTLHFDATPIFAANRRKTGLLAKFLQNVLFRELSLREGLVYGASVDFNNANAHEARLNVYCDGPLANHGEVLKVIRGVFRDMAAGSHRFEDQFDLAKRTVRHASEEHAANLLYDMEVARDALISEYLASGKKPDPQRSLDIIDSVSYAEALSLLRRVFTHAYPAVEYRGHTENLPTGQDIGRMFGLASQTSPAVPVRGPVPQPRRLVVAG